MNDDERKQKIRIFENKIILNEEEELYLKFLMYKEEGISGNGKSINLPNAMPMKLKEKIRIIDKINLPNGMQGKSHFKSYDHKKMLETTKSNFAIFKKKIERVVE